MKTYSLYICQQCGYKSPSFLGKCTNCASWSSLVETVEKNNKSVSWSKKQKRERSQTVEVVRLDSVKTSKIAQISCNSHEIDQVLGGGLIPGSVILLAGDPGIGKSTMTIQILSHIGGLYVSGEESAQQVKMRAER